MVKVEDLSNLNKLTNDELEIVKENIDDIIKSRSKRKDFVNFTNDEKIKYLNDYLDEIDFPKMYRWNEENLKSLNFYGTVAHFLDNERDTDGIDEMLEFYFNENVKKIYNLTNNICEIAGKNIVIDRVDYKDFSVSVKFLDSDRSIYFILNFRIDDDNENIYLYEISLDFSELFDIFLLFGREYKITESLFIPIDDDKFYDIVLDIIKSIKNNVATNLKDVIKRIK